jgi:hypothetical protein
MGIKVAGALLATIFSLSLISANADAITYTTNHTKTTHVMQKKNKNMKTHKVIHKTVKKNVKTSKNTGTGLTKPLLMVNPNTDVYGPNDSRFRTKENADEVYNELDSSINSLNLNNNLNSDTGTGVMNNNSNLNNNLNSDTGTGVTNNNTNTTDNNQNNVGNGITSQELNNTMNNVGTAMQQDVSTFNIRRYNGVKDCISQFSMADNHVVKNSAFFACQKYKIN